MCFSATASFASAAVLGAGGTATLAMVRRVREVPLALMGVGFAAHQAVEGIIWHRLEAGPLRWPAPALAVWVAYAWLALPVWVPAAVALVEAPGRRRRAMVGLTGAGAAVSTAIAVLVGRGTVTAFARSGHIAYVLSTSPGLRIGVPYVVVTCAPALLSSHRLLRWWGGALVASMAITALAVAREFESVWCFLAANLTLLLAVWFAARRGRGPNPTGTTSGPSGAGGAWWERDRRRAFGRIRVPGLSLPHRHRAPAPRPGVGWHTAGGPGAARASPSGTGQGLP